MDYYIEFIVSFLVLGEDKSKEYNILVGSNTPDTLHKDVYLSSEDDFKFILNKVSLLAKFGIEYLGGDKGDIPVMVFKYKDRYLSFIEFKI